MKTIITIDKFRDRVVRFQKGVESAYHHLEDIEAAIAQVGEMYPAIPAESWQDRNGKGRYLYMLFPSNGNGAYTGPDGKRKLYVGNKPERIEAARRLAANRRRYEELQRARRNLRYWIDARNRMLLSEIQMYPYPSAF